jgi:hypothetical protein
VKIRINGRDYPVIGHRSANLLHLIELREHTRGLFSEPLGMARLDEIERTAKALRARIAAAQEQREAAVTQVDGVEVVVDAEAVAAADELLERLDIEQVDDGLLGMAILLFLSRRKAGDRVTFAQAIDLDVAHDVEWIHEPGDALPVTPQPGDGVPLDGTVQAAPDPLSPACGSRVTDVAGQPDPDQGPDPVPVKRKRSTPKGGRSTTSRTP